jgi:hypothetical protein
VMGVAETWISVSNRVDSGRTRVDFRRHVDALSFGILEDDAVTDYPTSCLMITRGDSGAAGRCLANRLDARLFHQWLVCWGRRLSWIFSISP